MIGPTDKNGRYVIHGSADDDFLPIEPLMEFTNNASSNNQCLNAQFLTLTVTQVFIINIILNVVIRN